MSSTRASQSSPYLFLSRHGVWYARVVVPEDQRSVIGKRELRKSLSTKDKREAVRRSWGVLQQLMLVAKGKALAQPMEDTPEQTLLPVAISVEASPPVVNKPKLPKLSEVTELFCQEKIRQQAWSTHSEYVNRKTFKDMITLLGDIRFDEFTKEKNLRYKQHYSNNGKISITTVNKYLTRVTLFIQLLTASDRLT
ncbi:DUF6538 domain-containing protein [Shewanella sp. NFH-SH190041]|uniref:DUF6538 domain-containing protein n=1 Tax=Shewanella sp. NFH-SH190041 TaxID=2950245 RepID=UPI0021C4AD4F|nr:DUF6538 domain-containing protein [Shewanella sp. NFH-SH190041]